MVLIISQIDVSNFDFVFITPPYFSKSGVIDVVLKFADL